MKRTRSILLVGVGGQGTVLASRLLGNVLKLDGYDVKVSEVHGMSQRGGSVVTYVKYGTAVYSPLIDMGEADYIISFELLEAARYICYLTENGRLITSTQRIDPMPVITGNMVYPEDTLNELRNITSAPITAVDALALAKQAGSAKASNVVLMGVLSAYMNISEDLWEAALQTTVPPKFYELNKKAFALGRAAGKEELDGNQCKK